MPTKQLLLSKYLFKKGEETLEGSNAFAAGLAISLLQDSVELLLWTIAKEFPVSVKDKDSFDRLWDSIDGISNENKILRLSFHARMVELNKAV